MTSPPSAIVLAAGRGMRLRDVHSGSPKGLLRINGETLIGRSLRLLRYFGICRVILVTGFEANDYTAVTENWSGVELVHNDGYASNESMASLALALEVLGGDENFLLLESDLFYEGRALEHLLLTKSSNVVLVSGPTGAGDEVWVQERDGHLC